MLSRQRAFFICCQRWDSNSLLSVHKATTLDIKNVILIGSVRGFREESILNMWAVSADGSWSIRFSLCSGDQVGKNTFTGIN